MGGGGIVKTLRRSISLRFSLWWYFLCGRLLCLVLRFLAFFGKRQGRPPKKQGFLIPAEPPKRSGKEGKNAQKKHGIPRRGRNKDFNKTRNGRTGRVVQTHVSFFVVRFSNLPMQVTWHKVETFR